MVATLASSIEIDRPRLHHSPPPEVASWGVPVGASGEQPVKSVLHSQLVVLDPKGRRRSAVDVEFDRWVGSPSDITLLGHDQTSSLRLTLRGQPQGEETHLSFKFIPSPAVSPGALMPLLRWFEEYRVGRSAGVWDVDTATWLLGPDEIFDPGPVIARAYQDVVSALARIERRSGLALQVPSELDAAQVKEIEIADRLMKGAEVRGTWSTAELNDDPQVRDLLSGSPRGARFGFTTDHWLLLGDAAVDIGQVRQEVQQVVLSAGDTGDGPIQLVAGKRNGIEMRLVSVPARINTDGSTSWVPAPMLEPFKGQWIAQSGTTILASGVSRSHVVAAARARGLLATVWRVSDQPDDGGAAELIPV